MAEQSPMVLTMKRRWKIVLAALPVVVVAIYVAVLLSATPYWWAYEQVSLGMSREQVEGFVPAPHGDGRINGVEAFLAWQGQVAGQPTSIQLPADAFVHGIEGHPVLKEAKLFKAVRGSHEERTPTGLVHVKDEPANRIIATIWFRPTEAIAVYWDDAGRVAEKAYVQSRRWQGVREWLVNHWPF